MADNYNYWTVSYGTACRTGFSCRECRKVINKSEPIAIRDGRKMRFFYHRHCFSGSSDPRTQANSSFTQGRLPGTSFHTRAPDSKGHGKWSVQSYAYNPSTAAYSADLSNRSQEEGKDQQQKALISKQHNRSPGARTVKHSTSDQQHKDKPNNSKKH